VMREFRKCLGECDLKDMGCIEDPFTWRRGEIRERLDRAVCNLEWANKFPRNRVINEEHVHLIIVLSSWTQFFFMAICLIVRGDE
jgi:hypothetical protein